MSVLVTSNPPPTTLSCHNCNFNCYRGTLASRHKPSGEALKCQILKRQHFLSKDNSPAPPETSTPPQSPLLLPPPPPPPPPPAVPDPGPGPGPEERAVVKPAKVSLIADLQSRQKSRAKEEDSPSPERNEKNEESQAPTTDEQEKNQINKQKVPFLVELENSKNKGKLKSKTKRIDPPPGKKMESFGIQDQLRLKLEARKKLVEEAEEAGESQS